VSCYHDNAVQFQEQTADGHVAARHSAQVRVHFVGGGGGGVGARAGPRETRRSGAPCDTVLSALKMEAKYACEALATQHGVTARK
jgi:hypothetical protein